MNDVNNTRNEEIDERIDSFLRGKMTAEEETSFKDEVARDDYLKQRIREQILLIRGIQQFGKVEDEIVIDSVKQSTNKEKRSVWLRPFALYPLSLAAALLVFIFINSKVIFNSSMSYAEHESTTFISSMQYGVRGSEDSELVSHLYEDFLKVNKGEDLNNTILELEEQFKICRDEYIDEVDDYSSRIGWFLAVAYLKNGEKQKAKKILNYVIEDNPEAESAQILLDKLDRSFFWN